MVERPARCLYQQFVCFLHSNGVICFKRLGHLNLVVVHHRARTLSSVGCAVVSVVVLFSTMVIENHATGTFDSVMMSIPIY
jgi:hypothetical protein